MINEANPWMEDSRILGKNFSNIDFIHAERIGLNRPIQFLAKVASNNVIFLLFLLVDVRLSSRVPGRDS